MSKLVILVVIKQKHIKVNRKLLRAQDTYISTIRCSETLKLQNYKHSAISCCHLHLTAQVTSLVQQCALSP